MRCRVLSSCSISRVFVVLEAEKQELAKLNVVLAAIEGEMASLK